MKIALAQLEISADIQENLDKALGAMDQAASNNADLICFSEIHLSPFFPQYRNRDASDYLIPVQSDIIEQIKAKCAEHNLIAAPNLYIEENGKRYDATVMINADGTVLGLSKMVHIPQFAYFYEQDYYEPSDTGFRVYDTAFGKIGVIVCFDRHFPESFRTCVLQGADLIIIPTVNTKAEPSELFEWELRVPAMQNGLFVAMCNRVGVEDEMAFSGESIVVDPDGDVVVKADDRERILYADIDLNKAKRIRENRGYIELRRPEAYTV